MYCSAHCFLSLHVSWEVILYNLCLYLLYNIPLHRCIAIYLIPYKWIFRLLLIFTFIINDAVMAIFLLSLYWALSLPSICTCNLLPYPGSPSCTTFSSQCLKLSGTLYILPIYCLSLPTRMQVLWKHRFLSLWFAAEPLVPECLIASAQYLLNNWMFLFNATKRNYT